MSPFVDPQIITIKYQDGAISGDDDSSLQCFTFSLSMSHIQVIALNDAISHSRTISRGYNHLPITTLSSLTMMSSFPAVLSLTIEQSFVVEFSLILASFVTLMPLLKWCSCYCKDNKKQPPPITITAVISQYLSFKKTSLLEITSFRIVVDLTKIF